MKDINFIHKKKTFSFLSYCLQCLLKIESCLHSKHYQVRFWSPQSHPGLSLTQWYMHETLKQQKRVTPTTAYVCGLTQNLWQQLWLHGWTAAGWLWLWKNPSWLCDRIEVSHTYFICMCVTSSLWDWSLYIHSSCYFGVPGLPPLLVSTIEVVAHLYLELGWVLFAGSRWWNSR